MADPSFTFVQLRYFAAAAELGSMTAASRQLMVSQSAVSTAVAQLEKELGVQLLLRHHARGLTLTAAGQIFQQELRSYFVHTDELVESVRSLGGAMVGDLSIGCFSTIAPFRLPGLLAGFSAEYPDVRVNVVEGEHAELKSSLRQGRCEVALMYGFDLDEDIDHHVLDVAPPYAIVAVDHPLAKRRRKKVALSELADLPMVLLDLPHSGDYFRQIVADAGAQPNIRHRSTGYETVRAMVAHGHGYALLNQHPSHDMTYDGGQVVALELKDDLPPLEIVLAWMRGARLTGRAQAFTKSCRRVYARSRRARE